MTAKKTTEEISNNTSTNTLDNTTTTGEKDGTPKTGIVDIIKYVLTITVISALGIIVLNKKETK